MNFCSARNLFTFPLIFDSSLFLFATETGKQKTNVESFIEMNEFAH